MHGIDSAPDEDKLDGYPRKVWRRDGVDVIESITITGMAHGTPLATATHGGAAGPFMLEVGISSSYHIAKFFGLTGEGAARWQRPHLGDTHLGGTYLGDTARTPLVPDEVEVIPDERVEILDAKTEAPTFGAKSGEVRRQVRRRHRRDGGHHQGADAGRADEAAGVRGVLFV